MKSLKNIILGISCASAIALTGCIDETLPTHQATDEQLSSPKQRRHFFGLCRHLPITIKP